MKKYLLLLFFSALLMGSCRKSSVVPSLTSIITQGKWYVNLMKDQGFNNTAVYKNWQFSFQTDKTVTVTNGTTNYSGVWEEDSTGQHFTLQINSPQIELIHVSQVWDISLKTYGRIVFKDDKFNPSQELQITKF